MRVNKVSKKKLSYVLVPPLSVLGMMSPNTSRCRSAGPFTCDAVCPRNDYRGNGVMLNRNTTFVILQGICLDLPAPISVETARY